MPCAGCIPLREGSGRGPNLCRWCARLLAETRLARGARGLGWKEVRRRLSPEIRTGVRESRAGAGVGLRQGAPPSGLPPRARPLEPIRWGVGRRRGDARGFSARPAQAGRLHSSIVRDRLACGEHYPTTKLRWLFQEKDCPFIVDGPGPESAEKALPQQQSSSNWRDASSYVLQHPIPNLQRPDSERLRWRRRPVCQRVRSFAQKIGVLDRPGPYQR